MDLNGNCHNIRSMARSSRLLRYKANPDSDPENQLIRNTFSRSPIRPLQPTIPYDFVRHSRKDATAQGTIVQDIVQMKIMLIKLKRILSKEDEKSDEPNQNNGKLVKNGLTKSKIEETNLDDLTDNGFNHIELGKQIFVLQNQLEERDKTIKKLEEKITTLTLENRRRTVRAKSCSTTNATTQTEKHRPVSVGPILPPECNSSTDYLTSENTKFNAYPEETSSLRLNNHLRKSLPRLWRKSTEPSSLQSVKTTTSFIPRRAKSHGRTTSTPV